MKLFNTLSDYRKSIESAANGEAGRLAAATSSVLKARLRFDIGPTFHSLYDLHSKPDSEWPSYMLEKHGVRTLEQLSSRSVQDFLQDKLAFALHCHDNGLPTVPILFRCDNEDHPSYEKVFHNLATPLDWENAFAQAPDRVFAKLIDGRLGIGAFSITRIGKEWIFDGLRGSVSDLREFAMRDLGRSRGRLFQPALSPHPHLAQIMSPGSLGTVRASTYIDADGTHLMFPVLRIPAGNNVVDNFSRGMKGNLVAAIDMDTGRLREAHYSRSLEWPNMAQTDVHPDTGGRIRGREVPFWAEAKALMIRAQEFTPEPQTIGWDIAITADGPTITEANSLYATDIYQVAYGRGIKDAFHGMVSRVRAHAAARLSQKE